MPNSRRTASTVDAAEISRFAALAEEWWDESGPMRPLHAMNPLRLDYVKTRICRHFGLDAGARRPLDGLRVLDLGCGGGIVSEPLARLGADLVGVDAASDSIVIANRHGAGAGLAIDYRCTTAEALAEAGESFDVIVSMEVVEHVADLPVFLRATGDLLKAGGCIVLSTINRTQKSYILAIAVAEHLLRLLPPGTHDFNKFVRPGEMNRHLRAAGVTLQDVTGMTFSPLQREWRQSRDRSVNYLAFGTKD